MKYLIFLLFICTTSSSYSQTEGYAQSKDVKIWFRVLGKGEPLLIINGGPGMSSDGFVSLAKKLSAYNKVILFDQRGTGRSRLPAVNSNTITMDLMAEDLEALRRHLKLEAWNILGHSFGGMLASYYATIHPSRIKNLILSASGGIDLELTTYAARNINSKLSIDELESLKYWNQRIGAGDTSYHARLQRGTALAAAYVYDRKHIPVIARRLTEGNSRINSLVWNDLERIQFDCKEKLRSFKQPVLIIQGKQDIIELRTAQKAKDTFPNAKLVILDHCVHYGWLDNEAGFFNAISAFLKSAS